MIRRRFYSSYKSPVDNGVYAVKQDGRLIPLSKADYQCISVAIVHDDHKIMIEKNEDSNQSYKTATSGLMFVMPMLDIECDDIIIIIGFGIILSFILTIIPILLSYDIRDEIIELIGDMDSQIVVDTSVYKTNLP